ncbi:15385_t:CDS:2 [Acaulospora morrowiae]|uniref:15385_t:CDS:1 n=1 Tax=Acaulospora morrowiae TaxID=94023 RepID=A0A9N9D6K1_9GLOM|nr:15385_t:CDS:2 [Acaulospora morrowiae]
MSHHNHLSKLANIISNHSDELRINLIENTLFLNGSPKESLGCFLRGELVLNLAKATKIKKIKLNFIGKIVTLWKRPNNTNKFVEEEEIINHQWTFLDLTSPNYLSTKPIAFVNHKIPSGEYIYPFELFLPGSIPETARAGFGTISYELVATVTKSRFVPNVHVTKHVNIIRTYPNDLGIAIAKEWKNTLAYEINLPTKANVIGKPINIGLTIQPLAEKLRMANVQVSLVENTIYEVKGHRSVETKTISNCKITNFDEQTILKKEKNFLFGTSKSDYPSRVNREFLWNKEKDKEQNNIREINESGKVDTRQFTKNILFSFPSKINHSCVTSTISVMHYLNFTFVAKVPDKSKKSRRSAKQVHIKVPITICRFTDDLPLYEATNKDQLLLPEAPSYASIL